MNMKPPAKNHSLETLRRILASADLAVSEPARRSMLQSLDELVNVLQGIRVAITDNNLSARLTAIQPALSQVLEFIENAKDDPQLCNLLAITSNGGKVKKREPVEIPPNLSNQQIRELLERDLSVQELQTLASQRSISVHGANRDQMKREIIANLNRQEGYERLAAAS